jgi:hypothetical protein
MALQIRRGTTQQRLGITPLAGELVLDETSKLVFVGDGTTAGGVQIGVEALLAGSLTGDLSLGDGVENYDIVGTGNINISGNATLVDVTATGSIVVTGNVSANNFVITGTDPITANITGDVTGSVYSAAEDLLVDSANGKLVGPVENLSITSSSLLLNADPSTSSFVFVTDRDSDAINTYQIRNYADSELGMAQVYIRGRGTNANPTPLVEGDYVGVTSYIGLNDTLQPSVSAQMGVKIVGSDGTFLPGAFQFFVTPDGEPTLGLEVGADTVISVNENYVVAGATPGDVNEVAGVQRYLKLTVIEGGTPVTYAMPLYGLVP